MGEEAPELAATLADPLPTARDPKLTRAESVQPLDAFPRGSSIGRYLVLDVLGTGGMGVVYTAFDPKLDRKVAIKIVRKRRSRNTSDGPARMLREAQAIARISHPNVVAVHDVGTIDEQVFIAMELVAGDTLTAWLRARDRSAAEVVDVLVQAGRGLAAAHASGLVHRDFKPDNILVGHDGRARVVDFGLVREANAANDTPVENRASQPMLATPLTEIGVLMGTPIYMSPEQHLQQDADAISDQYSFCATLYEALAGTPPYRGETLADIRARVLAGNPPELPAARKVPAHVAAAIRRGLLVDPAARWPSMTALLAELERDPAARRRRWLVGSAIVGAVAVAAAAIAIPLAVRGSAAEVTRCGTAAAQIGEVWGPARRSALRTAFLNTKVPYAEGAYHSAARQLDAYATRWAQSHEDSCRATHVRGEQSLEMLDLRTACLHRRRTEVSSLVDVMLESDAKTVKRAHQAVAALSPVDDCNDLAALQAPISLPANPVTRQAVTDAREELARIKGLYAAGRQIAAQNAGTALAAVVAKIGYRPLEAEVGYLLGRSHQQSGDYESADRFHVKALAAAIASRHDEIMLRLLTSLMMNRADTQQFAAMRDFGALAEATAERLGNPPATLAYVHNAVGYALSSEGKYAAAAVEYERALAIRERIAPGSQEHARTLNGLARVYDEIGRYAEARQMGERSLALQQAELGASHPEVAIVLNNLGNIAIDEGDLALATTYYNRSLAIRELMASDGDDQLLLASVLNNIGGIALEQKRYADALAVHRRALAIREQATGGAPDVAMSLNNIGNTYSKQRDWAQAHAHFQKALVIAEKELGKEHPYVGDALEGIAECHLNARRYNEAKQALERVLAIRKLGARPIEIATAELLLARTLWGLGAGPRALTLARSARAAFAASPATKRQLAEADELLRTHR
jgi:tetratricopeptide (TPR) repeat protein/tRNA A-37 threonylcarbamoyl transferase component Bud32